MGEPRGRVTVDTGALQRLVGAAVATAQRSRVSDPELQAAIAGLLASSSPAPARRAALTMAEAAEALGVSERTVRRRVADGSLDHRRLGRRVLIPAEAVTSGQERPGAANRVAGRSDPGDAASNDTEVA